MSGKQPAKLKFVGLRIPEQVKAAWTRAAGIDGRTLSSWIVSRCNGIPTTAPLIATTTSPETEK